MKYDDASWHNGGDFPADLPPEKGATHIGMFVAWMVLNGFAGEVLEDDPHALDMLRAREISPGAWFVRYADEKFTDQDVTREGQAFTESYYAEGYSADCESVAAGLPTVYHLPDDWTTYDKLAPVIRARYDAWKRS